MLLFWQKAEFKNFLTIFFDQMIPRKSKFGVSFHIRVYTFSNIDEKQKNAR